MDWILFLQVVLLLLIVYILANSFVSEYFKEKKK
jgi:hypothetical protein